MSEIDHSPRADEGQLRGHLVGGDAKHLAGGTTVCRQLRAVPGGEPGDGLLVFGRVGLEVDQLRAVAEATASGLPKVGLVSRCSLTKCCTWFEDQNEEVNE